MAKHQSRRAVPSIESLEHRCLPAVDAFIWFASAGVMQVQGDTKADEFSIKKTTDKASFEIKDFSFGVENPTTIGSATGGAGAGKIKFNEFTIKKTTDKASPTFFKHSSPGDDYEPIVIEMRKAGGDPQSAGKSFLKFKFDTVFTTKIDWSGPGDEGPEESITFVYGKLGVKYELQQPNG